MVHRAIPNVNVSQVFVVYNRKVIVYYVFACWHHVEITAPALPETDDPCGSIRGNGYCREYPISRVSGLAFMGFLRPGGQMKTIGVSAEWNEEGELVLQQMASDDGSYNEIIITDLEAKMLVVFIEEHVNDKARL